jgi:acyl-CoA thioesterase FadM
VVEVSFLGQKHNAFRWVLLDVWGHNGHRNKGFNTGKDDNMYPYIRLAKEIWKHRNAPKLGILQPHISTHRIWPWDLDPWAELNNGRTLTLFDLGRIPMSIRMGFDLVAKNKGWGITVAGNTTRYRKRVTVWTKLTQVSRVIGWDDRFVYIEQTFWRGPECTAAMLLRSATTSKAGIVPTSDVLAALGLQLKSPDLPEWVQKWIAADALRPWPPHR